MDHRILGGTPVVDYYGTVFPERGMTGLGSEDVALDIGFGFVLHDDDVPGVDRTYLGTFVVVLHALRYDGAEGKRESGMYDERAVSA